jgi:hypothetical protein
LSIVPLAALIASGCDKPVAPGPAREGGLVAPSATAVVPTAPAPAPPDIDVSPIQKQLKCGGLQHKEACRVLDEFAAAQRWQVRMPSGEGRWVGRAFPVAKGADTTELILLSARMVPTNTIGPGDLPMRVGTGPMPEDKRVTATKLVNALSRSDTVPRTNAALVFAKTWLTGRECSVVGTTGPSVRLVSEYETYIREAPAQKLVFIQLRGGAPPGDGVYAEVWPINW